jgi:hypothetical protein
VPEVQCQLSYYGEHPEPAAAEGVRRQNPSQSPLRQAQGRLRVSGDYSLVRVVANALFRGLPGFHGSQGDGVGG